MKIKILYVVNVDWFFISHRLPIALEAIKKGYEVHIACAITDKLTHLTDQGLIVHPIEFSRSGRALSEEFRTCARFYQLVKNIKPDLIHLITIKPVLYGGIISRVLGVPCVVSAISGLGFLFVKRESMFANIFRFCTLLLYRLAMGHKNQKVIFQNTSDEKALIDSGGVSSHKSVLIKGSGVYLDEYPYNKIIHNPPVIVMASRLLRDKGVIEFIEAARRIKKYNKNVIFRLVGQIDSENPESVTEHELQLWKNEGIVEILGYRMDIADIFTNASIVVLPSYYGEGLPKVLIEAAASGRAVVTTDMPGCRDSIIEGLTGLLIPPKDVDALVDSLDLLINDTELCVKLGEQGRKLAEAEYDLFSVIRKHLALYDELLTG